MRGARKQSSIRYIAQSYSLVLSNFFFPLAVGFPIVCWFPAELFGYKQISNMSFKGFGEEWLNLFLHTRS